MNRPRTGLHAPAADNRRSGNTWFSRIVDPASRLITQGAVKRLSSVFKKNHPARPSARDVVEEIEEDSLQEVPEEAVENAKVLGQDEEDTRVSKQRSEPEFTEVEQLLKNKTFSREEFNRLTELLQSRIVDRSAGLNVCEEQSREELHGGAGPSNAVNAEAQRWREERQKAREEKNDSVWHNSLYDNAPTPIFGLTNSNSAFGAAPSPTPPADQMEDSMAEDPAQVSSPVPPVFVGQTASPAPSFVFGSQPTAPSAGQSVFQFGAQPGPAAANPFASSAPSTFNPAGGSGLEFSGGGFYLGAGGDSTFNPAGGSGLEFSGGGFYLGAGGDRCKREFIKAKRDKTRRK